MLWIERDGRAGGLFLASAAALDAVLAPARPAGDAPAPASGGAGPQQLRLTFRAASGGLDVFVFAGPSPLEVLAQYHALIGPPALPPRWGLGFHVCRWGYHDLAEARAPADALAADGFPFDVAWLDIDYMLGTRDFTLDEGRFPGAPLRDWAAGLHAGGRRLVVINDPGIPATLPDEEYPPFAQGLQAGAFILAGERERAGRGGVALGAVWPGVTAFADLAAEAGRAWWAQQLRALRALVPVDGLWLDMGEPSVFRDAPEEALEARGGSGSASPSPAPDDPAMLGPPASRAAPPRGIPHGSGPLGAWVDLTWPPFLPGARGGARMLEEKTLPVTSRTALGRHYDTHSLFGLLEARATAGPLRAMTGERQFIISRSTFPGHGAVAGQCVGRRRGGGSPPSCSC